MDTATGEDRERYERALREQCAMEKRSILFLKRCLRGLRGQPDMERRFMWHVEESEAQARRLATLLSGRGTKPLPGNAAPSVTGWLRGILPFTPRTTPTHVLACKYREIAAYEALLDLADAGRHRAGIALLTWSLNEERAMAAWLLPHCRGSGEGRKAMNVAK